MAMSIPFNRSKVMQSKLSWLSNWTIVAYEPNLLHTGCVKKVHPFGRFWKKKYVADFKMKF